MNLRGVAIHRGRHRNLLEICDDRYGLRAKLVTSQIPVEKWHEYLDDPTVANAILDRLIHNAYRIILKGESMASYDADRVRFLGDRGFVLGSDRTEPGESTPGVCQGVG